MICAVSGEAEAREGREPEQRVSVLAALAEMPALEEVQLHGALEDVGELPALARLPRLAKLDVKYTIAGGEPARGTNKRPW